VAQTTSFVSSNQLTAAISSSQIAEPDTAVVYVYNPVNGTTLTSGSIASTNSNSCSPRGSNAVSFSP
jgi:hypothetical protein